MHSIDAAISEIIHYLLRLLRSFQSLAMTKMEMTLEYTTLQHQSILFMHLNSSNNHIGCTPSSPSACATLSPLYNVSLIISWSFVRLFSISFAVAFRFASSIDASFIKSDNAGTLAFKLLILSASSSKLSAKSSYCPSNNKCRLLNSAPSTF